MDLGEYKKRYPKPDESAPGWDSIDKALHQVYGDQKPKHWGTILSMRIGGNDPIDGISAYSSKAGDTSHLHFCTYGFSSLYYDEDSAGKDYSNFGFELTFRLKKPGDASDR